MPGAPIGDFITVPRELRRRMENQSFYRFVSFTPYILQLRFAGKYSGVESMSCRSLPILYNSSQDPLRAVFLSLTLQAHRSTSQHGPTISRAGTKVLCNPTPGVAGHRSSFSAGSRPEEALSPHSAPQQYSLRCSDARVGTWIPLGVPRNGTV
jgi:hypothetical protein